VRGLSDSALKILASYWSARQHPRAQNLIGGCRVSDREFITDEDLRSSTISPSSIRARRQASSALPGGKQIPSGATSSCALEKKDWNVTATARYLGSR
jgi:hypothetical protein